MGTQSSERVTKPDALSNLPAKRGSVLVSLTTSGFWCSATQPAMPWPTGSVMVLSALAFSPEATLKNRFLRSSVTSMVALASESSSSSAAAPIFCRRKSRSSVELSELAIENSSSAMSAELLPVFFVSATLLGGIVGASQDLAHAGHARLGFLEAVLHDQAHAQLLRGDADHVGGDRLDAEAAQFLVHDHQLVHAHAALVAGVVAVGAAFRSVQLGASGKVYLVFLEHLDLVGRRVVRLPAVGAEPPGEPLG